MKSTGTRTFKALSDDVAGIARRSSDALARYAQAGQANPAQTVEMRIGGDALSLPYEALAPIASVLREMSRGHNVQIVSTNRELTTQQAADILSVSRPYLVKLLRQRAIPYRSVGTRRRIMLEDLLEYKERESARRLEGVDELVAESQRLDLC